MAVKRRSRKGNQPIKTEIASVKEEAAWVRGKFDIFDKHIRWLTALIAVSAVIPPIVILWHDRKDRVQQKQIETLMNEIEKLKQQRIVNPRKVQSIP